MITIRRQEWDEAFQKNLERRHHAMTESRIPLTPYGNEVCYERAYEDTLYDFGIISNYGDDINDELMIVDDEI